MKNFGAGLALLLMLIGQAAFAQAKAPNGAVGCVSQDGLMKFIDAKESNDRATLAGLLNGECRPLDGKEYSVIEDRNGSLKILVLSKPDDWESAQVFYTLDEILQLS